MCIKENQILCMRRENERDRELRYGGKKGEKEIDVLEEERYKEVERE